MATLLNPYEFLDMAKNDHPSYVYLEFGFGKAILRFKNKDDYFMKTKIKDESVFTEIMRELFTENIIVVGIKYVE